jgi:hypothetical protein
MYLLVYDVPRLLNRLKASESSRDLVMKLGLPAQCYHVYDTEWHFLGVEQAESEPELPGSGDAAGSVCEESQVIKKGVCSH